MDETKVGVTATQIAVGAAIGATPALAQIVASPQFSHQHGLGAVKASAKFSQGFTQSLHKHQGVQKAVGAGVVAVLGHGVLGATAGTAVVAAAPFVAVGGALYGAYKLIQWLKD